MKPKIICHMLSSVDGRLMPNRYSLPYDGKDINEIIAQYTVVGNELKADAIMLGRKTIQEFYLTQTFDYKKYKPAHDAQTFVGNRNNLDTIIIIDPKGKVVYDNSDKNNYIAILSKKVSDEYLSFLRERKVSYVFAGADGSDLESALKVLSKDFGLNIILLEGGGIINGAFLEAKLIDELSLMIYPGVDGLSGVASIFEYMGEPNAMPSKGQSLELVSMKQLQDGVALLYYKFHKI